jgi:hypothetical protein
MSHPLDALYEILITKLQAHGLTGFQVEGIVSAATRVAELRARDGAGECLAKDLAALAARVKVLEARASYESFDRHDR